MKKPYSFVTVLLTAGVLAACGGSNDNAEEVNETGVNENENKNEAEVVESTEPLQVKTTIYPLQYFTEEIGQEYVEVANIMQAGSDAHTFEPSTNQMIEIAESDLFLYNGADFEGYAASIRDALEGEDVTIFEATHELDLISFSHGISEHDDHDNDHNDGNNDDHDHEEDNGHNDDHNDNEDNNHGHNNEQNDDHDIAPEDSHGAYDPHVWLDPVRSIEYAEQIKTVLIELMPEKEDAFNENFHALEEKLLTLDDEFQTMMDEVSQDIIVVSHAGYGYWTDRYGIQQLGISGLSPSNEPSIQQLQDIISQMDEYNLDYVMIEPNIPTNLIETVQNETGAEALRIHNLENLTEEDAADEDDYMSLMRGNIEALRTALE